MIITKKITDAIKLECDRQLVGKEERGYLLEAYRWAEIRKMPLTEDFLAKLARMIEPSNGGQYRHLPVTFHGIVGGVEPREIWYVMQRWIQFFNVEYDTWKEHPDSHWREIHADAVIKEFLNIHPFSDGNGRTAWLLRVWMLNQWDDPQPLPDYYGELKK